MFKKMISFAAVAGLVLAMGASANAATIVYNVNMGGGSGSGGSYEITTADNYQGAAPENTANSYWNPASKNGGETLTDMDDSQGNNTSVDFTFTGMTGSQAHGDGDLFSSYAMWGGGTLTLSNLTVAAGVTYDLVVYSNWGWGVGSPTLQQDTGTGLTGTFTINCDGSVMGGFVEDTNPANVAGTYNYARLTGLSPNTVEIDISHSHLLPYGPLFCKR